MLNYIEFNQIELRIGILSYLVCELAKKTHKVFSSGMI